MVFMWMAVKLKAVVLKQGKAEAVMTMLYSRMILIAQLRYTLVHKLEAIRARIQDAK